MCVPDELGLSILLLPEIRRRALHLLRKRLAFNSLCMLILSACALRLLASQVTLPGPNLHDLTIRRNLIPLGRRLVCFHLRHTNQSPLLGTIYLRPDKIIQRVSIRPEPTSWSSSDPDALVLVQS